MSKRTFDARKIFPLAALQEADPSAQNGFHAAEIDSIYNFLYVFRMELAKPIIFCGSSLDDLRAFPLSARREAGHQLDQVQNGLEPDNWKPMQSVGPGVQEIRVRDTTGAFRILYVAKFAEAVYVLHCFQKKTQKARKADLDLAEQRYRELLKERLS